jgi:hypothetical protein
MAVLLLTHPVGASRGTPLFGFAGKRGLGNGVKNKDMTIPLVFYPCSFVKFKKPSFRRRRREGGPAKRRPGESNRRHIIID